MKLKRNDMYLLYIYYIFVSIYCSGLVTVLRTHVFKIFYYFIWKYN